MYRVLLTIALLLHCVCSDDEVLERLFLRAERFRAAENCEEAVNLHRRYMQLAHNVAGEEDRVTLSLKAQSDCAVLAGDIATVVRYRKLIAGREKSAENYLHLAEAIVALRDPTEMRTALAAFRKASELGSAKGDVGACRLLAAIGQPAAAAPLCKRAIDNLPATDVPEAQRLLGDALRESGRYNGAARAYAEALAGESGVQAASGLILTLTWTGRFDLVEKAFTVVRQRLPIGDATQVVDILSPWVALLLGRSPSECLRVAERHVHSTLQNMEHPSLPPTVMSESTPLHIGYLSADFAGFSPVGQDLKHAFTMHGHTVRVTCYSLAAPDGSALNAAIRTACPNYVDLSALTSGEAARLIRSQNVDILIDLTGYTQGERSEILAMQPAPVQVEWKGFMGTTAAPYISYAVADRISVRPSDSVYFTEKLMYMPHTLFTCDLKQDQQQVITQPLSQSARSMYGLPVDSFVFACFNRLFKLDALTWRSWLQILDRVPNSVLWLLKFPPEAEPALRATARQHGISNERIIFSEVFPAADHLRIKALADLFLDTPTFNAHGTAAEALWATVPVLTLPGRTMAQRLGQSILSAAVPDSEMWVRDLLTVHSIPQYVERAVQIARDPLLHQRIREVLRQSRLQAPLFDTRGFMQQFEQLLKLSAELHMAGVPPRHIILH